MDLGEVPDFDPLDGGTAAKVLLLLEKPGPRAFESGFISRNNNDQTAENTFEFLLASGLERRDACLWNVIPFWNGTTKVSPQELQLGVQCLAGLFAMLPLLRVIILVGRKAERALPLLVGQKYVVLTSFHPSPKVYASMREQWLAIPDQWAKALPCLRDTN